jgi:hypothetical protein
MLLIYYIFLSSVMNIIVNFIYICNMNKSNTSIVRAIICGLVCYHVKGVEKLCLVHLSVKWLVVFNVEFVLS